MSTVALTIDYSNGAQKHFSSIPWEEDLLSLEPSRRAREFPLEPLSPSGLIGPGTLLGSSSTRCLTGIPGHPNGLSGSTRNPFRPLGTETSFKFHPDERADNLLNPGDHVLIKLSLAAEKPA